MFFQGILLGISLSFLVGPLLFAVIEAGIGQGFRAGVAVASGIWASDIIFVGVVLWGVETLAALTAAEGFGFWAGILGGLLLITFGAVSFISNPKLPKATVEAPSLAKNRSYLQLWLRGFLINTINPGTIFFWLGIVGAVVAPNNWTNSQSLIFFAGMMGALVVTDILKAWGAKSIRRFLTPAHIRQVQRGIGLVLMIFGLVLMVRAVWNR